MRATLNRCMRRATLFAFMLGTYGRCGRSLRFASFATLCYCGNNCARVIVSISTSNIALSQSRFRASECEQVLCSSWNRAKVAQILEEEQPLSTFAANRKALGANDSTVFDYCNCSSQPADQDIIDSLRLNPKVTPCCFAIGVPSLNCVPVFACVRGVGTRSNFVAQHRRRCTNTCLIQALLCITPCCMGTGHARFAQYYTQCSLEYCSCLAGLPLNLPHRPFWILEHQQQFHDIVFAHSNYVLPIPRLHLDILSHT
jgi:hypothetical protein